MKINRIQLDGSLEVDETRFNLFKSRFPKLSDDSVRFLSVETFYIHIVLSEVIRRSEEVNFLRDQVQKHLESARENGAIIWYDLRRIAVLIAESSLLVHPSHDRKFPKESPEEFKLRKIVAKYRKEILRILTKTSMEDRYLDRGLRDRFAHFDEAFDSWLIQSERRLMMSNQIVGFQTVRGLTEKEIFEIFDPTSWSFKYRGETFDLGSMIESLNSARIHGSTSANFIWKNCAS